jgi:hypothetical protein
MKNECSDCGANIASNQTKCNYCGKLQLDANEQLLTELINVVRECETAYAHGNKLVVESLLADNYELVEIDGGGELRVDRKTTLENAAGDNNFLSCSISDEELLERTPDVAKIACVQTVHRRMDGDNPYRCWAKIHFIWREGRWQIAFAHQTTIDENGQETEA